MFLSVCPSFSFFFVEAQQGSKVDLERSVSCSSRGEQQAPMQHWAVLEGFLPRTVQIYPLGRHLWDPLFFLPLFSRLVFFVQIGVQGLVMVLRRGLAGAG